MCWPEWLRCYWALMAQRACSKPTPKVGKGDVWPKGHRCSQGQSVQCGQGGPAIRYAENNPGAHSVAWARSRAEVEREG